MKADYLQYIYECLSGENGCLLNDKTTKDQEEEDLPTLVVDGDEPRKKTYITEFKMRQAAEIGEDENVTEMPEVWYNLLTDERKKIFSVDEAGLGTDKDKLEHFYKQKMTLLELMEHETIIEYEHGIR